MAYGIGGGGGLLWLLLLLLFFPITFKKLTNIFKFVFYLPFFRSHDAYLAAPHK